MQTESGTYRKGRMSALPAAKPGANVGQGGGERSRRDREDKRQLSDRGAHTSPPNPPTPPGTQGIQLSSVT